MAIELVIFDWDGTLMDSQAKIVNCMQQAATLCDVPVPTDDQVKHIIGISLLPAIKKLFELQDDETSNELAVKLRDAYKDVFLTQDKTACPLFEGVLPMLESLKTRGLPLAVATGKARRGLERAWEATATKDYFISSRCADDAQSKPSPDMLNQLLAERGLSPSQAIMVGDTCYDMQMANDIGMKRIGVSYGVHDEAMLNTQSPTYIVHSITELEKTLHIELDG